MRHLWLLVSLAGCFEPAQGTWTTSGSEVTTTTCAERDQHPVRDGAAFTLVTIEKNSFRLRFDGEPAFGCATRGKSFTCGVHHDDIDASDDGSAVLHLATTFDGTFLGKSSLSAHRYVDTTCEGETCEGVADAQGRTFPCSTTAAFAAVLTDPTVPTPGDTDAEDTDAAE